MKGILAITIVAFFLSISPALAVTFDASIYPTTINSGSDNVLVNFTVENTGGVGISQVNVTLPSGFSYYGSPGTTVSSSNVLFNPSSLGWYNKTTSSIVGAGGTSYFWFRVSTASAGNYQFRIYTTDTSSAVTYENVSVTTSDLTAPTWSANSTTPSTPTSYVSSQNYTFNITWNENTAIDNVKFEWDQSTNYTSASTPAVQNLGSGKYSITLRDLSTGNYTYKWYAEDSTGLENSTSLMAYNITLGSNPITLYFNGNSNQNIVINHGEEINVTATGGSVTLYKNNTVISNPYIDALPIGAYQFKANSSGNSNYTSNATGKSYTLRVVHPAPKYSVSNTIPSTWYANAYGYFNVTWSDENDNNGFDIALIQLNHSGSMVNYTMSRISGTNTSTYSLNISKPMAITWRVYANNSYGTWNSTSLETTTIGKIAPILRLTSSPDWSVARGTQTSVHCISDEVDVVLYRGGSVVSNPDIQTLGSGYYVYWCNSSATGNYSSASNSSILKILKYVGDVSFSDVENTVSIEQGSSVSTVVVLENIGNASQTIGFAVENITANWYSVNASSVTTGVGKKAAFLVNFTIGSSADVGYYDGVYRASDNTNNVTYEFTLKVMPNTASKGTILDYVTAYKSKMTEIWASINNSKGTLDVTLAEGIIVDAKEQIDLAENYIGNDDYFSANELLDGIQMLLNDAEEAFSNAGGTVEEIIPTIELESWVLWTVIVVVIVVVGFFVYILWPEPGYSPKTGKYRYNTQKGKMIVSKVKNKLRPTKRGEEINIDDLKKAQYSFKPEKKKTKAGKEKVVSKIKGIFKKKK